VHRSDAGAFLLADAYGARRCVYVKDRDLGSATLGAAEVRDHGDSPVDPLVLDLMATAKHVREIQVVDGRTRGALSDAVNGKPLWHSRIGGITAAPETYMIDGRQHVLVTVGDALYAFVLN
jgi:hypothetical protein